MPYDLQKPLARVGDDKSDRLLISDVTRFGLHRRVIARKDEVMDIDAWIDSVRQQTRAELYWWLVWIEGFYFLWIVWKER